MKGSVAQLEGWLTWSLEGVALDKVACYLYGSQNVGVQVHTARHISSDMPASMYMYTRATGIQLSSGGCSGESFDPPLPICGRP